MRIKCLKRLFGTCTTLSLVAGLFACGGGGGDATGTFTSNPNSGSGNPANPSPPATTTPIADGKLHAACSNCGALDDSTYAGSGVGIWQALNPGAQTRAVDVAIKGAAGRDLTLVFTNERVDEATHASFFGASIVTLPRDVAFAAALSASIPASHAENPDIQSVREFNSNGWKALIKAQQAAGAAHKAQLTHPVQRSAARDDIGAARDFWLLDKSRRHTTLQASATTSDGTQVNIWVENPEYGTGKVTPDIVSTLLRNYAGAGGVYDMVTRVGGALWGAVPTPGMIPAQQPIDLVVANFDNDGRPYGTIGYFWALNNFANQGSGETYYSNANLSLYLDSETLYLAGAAGAKRMQPVLAHESTHMLDFYRRDMLMGPQYSFDTWLAETAATMMADWVSFNLDPTYNSVRDDRFRIYLTYNNQGSYTCGLMTWEPGGAACDSYMTNGSFGGFLNRQFGLDFFKTLLADRNATGSMDILNDAIKRFRPDSSIAQEFRHFAVAAAAQIPLAASLAPYSFPSRTEGGFTLPAIDPSAMARNLPSVAPDVLPELASFPAVRRHIASDYRETLMLPPGMTLSVVVQ